MKERRTENGRRYIQGKTGINVQKRERYKNGPTLGGNAKAHSAVKGLLESPLAPIRRGPTRPARPYFESWTCAYCPFTSGSEEGLLAHLKNGHGRYN